MDLDLPALVAIDVHVHCEVSRSGRPSPPAQFLDASQAHVKTAEEQRLPSCPKSRLTTASDP